MNTVHILDCTLRDGGYCNEWRFGFENAKKIVYGLLDANIEIIECGFISNRVSYDPNVTKYSTIEEAAKVIPENKDGKIFVVMLNFGEYDVDDIPDCDGSTIDGIRVAYHKKDRYEALELCKMIKKKGYLVFIQAMVSLSYTDEEFLDTIKVANSFKPYAFYIVDSFGIMKEKDLTRLFYMVEHNLDPDVWIGFHSHNNLQLAYSNAQKLTMIQTNRSIIIDSSIYGMGRGAGNLNTELFVDYLNENAGKNYRLKPLFVLIDEILNVFYQKNYWGYSLPNYISATHNAHPNYARYLDDKKTLTIEGMNDIFDLMDEEKKVSYDKRYIEKLYQKYMISVKAKGERKTGLKMMLEGKDVLLIAPGKSSVTEKDKILNLVTQEEIVIISVNHTYTEYKPDFVFLSNNRRYREICDLDKKNCIVTSNVTAKDVYMQVEYRDLLNNVESVSDNAGLMAIKFLMNNGASKIYLAGFDGYSHDDNENYGKSEMAYIIRNEVIDEMNAGMNMVIKEYHKDIEIEFLTTPRFIVL